MGNVKNPNKKEMDSICEDVCKKNIKLLDCINEGVVFLDKSGKILYVNKKAIQFFGGARKGLVGRHFTKVGIFLVKEIPTLIVNFKKILAGQKSSLTMQIRNKRGQEVYLECSTEVMKISNKASIMIVFMHDITERKEQEKKYKTIVQASIDGFWLTDMQGNFLDVNTSYCKRIGYSREELLKMRISDVEVAENLKEIKNHIRKVKKVGGDRFETKHRCKDGRIIDTEISVSYLKTAEQLFVFLRDITERKKTEEKLRASEKKYRTLIENLPQKIFLKDKNSVYISCNESYARDLKIEPDEIPRKTDYNFFPKELAEKYRADDKRIMESGKIEDIEEKYIQGNQEIWVHTVKTPLKDENGRVTGVLGIFWDISEKKKVEDELSELNKRIEFILGATKTGLDIIDSNFNLLYIDPEWAKVYGNPKGKKCYEYFMGSKKICLNCGIRKALETKKPVISEETLVKENNRPIQVTTLPFQDKTGKWFVAEVNVDITERKKAEEELKKRTEELERFNKFAIERELKMIELKKRIEGLEKKSSKK